jgi:hypothetical protein
MIRRIGKCSSGSGNRGVRFKEVAVAYPAGYKRELSFKNAIQNSFEGCSDQLIPSEIDMLHESI